ncbi:MAG: hypothetical protein DRQ04_03390 [Candidatus Hydrothermota bacterium]|nr:MAG: hypothetical protein DRQ04_03390 [Candidatus Hydrothermae bacterium]
MDEIQYLRDPSKFIKLIVDHHSDKVKLVVTGFSALGIKMKFRDSLVGVGMQSIVVMDELTNLGQAGIIGQSKLPPGGGQWIPANCSALTQTAQTTVR